MNRVEKHLRVDSHEATGPLETAMRWVQCVGAMFLACILAGAQVERKSSEAPGAAGESIVLKGKIARVNVARGQGTPTLEISHDGKTSRVVLGSMRYMVEQDFAPKAGEPVEATVLKAGDVLFAIRVELPEQGKSLRLRTDDGWPVWRRAGRQHGQRRMY